MALTQYKGTIQKPGQRPETVDIVTHEIPELTRAERAAGLEWVDGRYEPGNVLRYGTNTTPGTTNMTAACLAARDVALQGSFKVIFPPEDLLIDQTVAFVGNNWHIVASPQTRIIWDGPTTVSAIEFGDLTTPTQFVRVDNLQVRDNTLGTGDGTTHGLVSILYCTRSAFYNLRVSQNTGTALQQGHGLFLERCWQNSFYNFQGSGLNQIITTGDNSEGTNGINWFNPTIEGFYSGGVNIPDPSFINQWAFYGGTIQGGENASNDANGVDILGGAEEFYMYGTYFELNNYDVYINSTGSNDRTIGLFGTYHILGTAASGEEAHIYHDGAGIWLECFGGNFQHRDGVWIADTARRYRGVGNTTPSTAEIASGSNPGDFVHYDQTSGAGYLQNFGPQRTESSHSYGPVTFAAADATPSVSGSNFFYTDSGTLTITDFDDPTEGQQITVVSKGAVTYDTTSSGLIGSSTDIVTANGDVTTWIYDGNSSQWRLTGYVDTSVDNSAGA